MSNSKNKSTLTPMMRQYYEIKNLHPDKYLFFRLGDFYEMFDQDAIEVSTLLQITLTERNKTPMCGIPHHQLHRYTHRIISQGKKIVIVEQGEKFDATEGLVERRISQIITPGTTLDEMNLTSKAKNFIISVYFHLKKNEETLFDDKTPQQYVTYSQVGGGIIALETTTGEVVYEEIADTEMMERVLGRFFENYTPSEMVITSLLKDEPIIKIMEKNYPELIINYSPSPTPIQIKNKLEQIYELKEYTFTDPLNWRYYGLHESLYLLTNYVETNYGEKLNYLRIPKVISTKMHMVLDQQTLIQLEIFKNNHDHSKKHSLLSIIDYTTTSMGARELQESLALPSLDLATIEMRLSQTEFFFNHPHFLITVREQLKGIADLERISTRLSLKRIFPREFIQLKKSLVASRNFFLLLREKNPPWLFELFKEYNLTFNQKTIDETFKEIDKEITKLIMLTDENLVEDPLNDINKGNFIKPSAHSQLEKYHHLKNKGQQLLNELESKEQKNNNINTLKIRYNENSGYFFEIRKSQLEKIPTHFIRKQSLVNSERFVSEELLELDAQINEAKNNSLNLEKQIYEDLVDKFKSQINFFQSLASIISRLDLASSLAELANVKGWCKPQMTTNGTLEIKDGRHPVVEASSEQSFIPNGLLIGTENDTIQIITGPNMSGKSTFLRQNAIIIILAHMGSYVPAQSATVPLCDQVFTRIGSGDRLFQGESTFLVEMKETAHILKHMTKRSFVIMDEIGRGTSTYDGLALAWSILEYISSQPEKKCKTMFATHYHELINLNNISGISHYYVAVKEQGEEIIFLKKVLRGIAGRSYGTEVAKLAGLPNVVVENAEKLLKELEKKSSNHFVKNNQQTITPKPTSVEKEPSGLKQLTQIAKHIDRFNINENTPLEAVNFIESLKKEITKYSTQLNTKQPEENE